MCVYVYIYHYIYMSCIIFIGLCTLCYTENICFWLIDWTIKWSVLLTDKYVGVKLTSSLDLNGQFDINYNFFSWSTIYFIKL